MPLDCPPVFKVFSFVKSIISHFLQNVNIKFEKNIKKYNLSENTREIYKKTVLIGGAEYEQLGYNKHG